jgi:hypothetical protein
MKVFDIVSGEIIIDPSRLVIPEFNKLWMRDKSKDKHNAMKEIAYITFLFDLSADNPYRGYTEYERDFVLKKDLFNDPNFVPDEALVEAIAKFKKLMETTNTRVLLGAKKAAEELAKWFEQIDFTKVDNYGKPIFSARELSSNLKEVGNIVKSLGLLEDMVRREQLDKATSRGGSDIGMYEIPMLNSSEYGL